MAEQDSLSGFDFNKISKPGKYLKFEAGRPVTIRVLTKDPVVQEKEFTNKKTGETNMSVKFCFVVWNFTDEIAQILSAGANMSKTFQRTANDPDFGSNLQKCDIKISPEGEMLERVYDINVLRHSGNEKEITAAMVKEAQEINLDKDITDGNRGRLSKWDPAAVAAKETSTLISKVAPSNRAVAESEDEDAIDTYKKAVENEGINDDDPINLDDIPF